MNILYITSSSAYYTNAIYDYDSSFSLFSKNNIFYFNIERNLFCFPLDDFDAIIFSYSFFALTNNFSSEFKKKISAFSGTKIAIFQDEYNSFLRHRENLKHFDITAIVTLVPEEHWNDVFQNEFSSLPHMHVLAGYIPEHLKTLYNESIPLDQRKWHIGYRGRIMPHIYGKLTREKYEIGVVMKDLCAQHNIPANIEVQESKRIYGKGWIDFIRNCRLLLGTESGSNVFDFDGRAAQSIESYMQQHPDATFDEVHDKFLSKIDGVIKMNQISPKMFEAIALGTGHILFEGNYSGILVPWKHYIPLKKDYSNVYEVFDAAKDIELVKSIINSSLEDILFSDKYSYKKFINDIDIFIDSLTHKDISNREQNIPLEVNINVPSHLSENELIALQQNEIIKVRDIARKIQGKSTLFFGAGAALDEYLCLFKKETIIGVLVDDIYINNATTISELPIISTSKIDAIKPENIVVFSRIQHRFSMLERIKELFPCGPDPECCILYHQKKCCTEVCQLVPVGRTQN